MSKAGDGAEESAAEREQEFRLLVDAIPTLVWSAGSDGNIEYVNKRALEYFGAPLSEIIGWGWTEKAHPQDGRSKQRLGSRISNPGVITT